MIEVEGLQKVKDQNLVLDIASLRVDPGEAAAVVGAAGSGKAVLFDLLLGRTEPTAGRVRVAGIDPASDRESFSQRVGVLFGEDSLYGQRSVQGNLLFHGQLRGLPRARTEEVLDAVGLRDHAQVRADKLPSGLQRRLAYGRAILHEPQVLLLVDPLARCDDASIRLLRRLMRAQADEGGTVLVLGDDAVHLSTVCDVVHTLEQGRIAESHRPGQDSQEALPFKIPVRLEDKVALVNPGDIRYAMAQDGRAFLQTPTDLLPTQFTLAELEGRLSRSGFFRAHRGYLVNLQHVKEVIPYTRNSYTLVLDDDETEIPLSKSAARELRELLGY